MDLYIQMGWGLSLSARGKLSIPFHIQNSTVWVSYSEKPKAFDLSSECSFTIFIYSTQKEHTIRLTRAIEIKSNFNAFTSFRCDVAR